MRNLVNSWQERLQLISVIVSVRTNLLLRRLIVFVFVDYLFCIDRSSYAREYETGNW